MQSLFKMGEQETWSGESLIGSVEPQCPIAELGCYHGISNAKELKKRLVRAGDFLVFCDEENMLKPTLLIMDVQQRHIGTFPIKKNRDGTFFIEKNKTDRYYTIGSAVLSCKNESASLKEISPSGIRLHALVRQVIEPLYEEMRLLGARGIQWSSLPFYHGHISHEEARKKLQRNGDFLLRSGSIQEKYHFLLITVQWNAKVRTLSTKLHPVAKQYSLPRTSKLQPLETVATVEEFMKAVVAGQCLLDYCILKRAIECSHDNKSKNRCPLCTNDDPTINYDVAKNLIKPLNSLPYYHGELASPMELPYKHKSVGSYALYISLNLRKLLLAVVCHRYQKKALRCLIFFEIKKSKDGSFHIKGSKANASFYTISELINYHVNNRVELLKQKQRTTAVLTQPILNRKATLHNIDILGVAECVPPYVQMKVVQLTEQLTNHEGDFTLMSNAYTNSLTLFVRWRGRIKTYQLHASKWNDRYLLPRSHPKEPQEWVYGLYDFLKALANYGLPLGNVFLRRFIPIDRVARFFKVRFNSMRIHKSTQTN